MAGTGHGASLRDPGYVTNRYAGILGATLCAHALAMTAALAAPTLDELIAAHGADGALGGYAARLELTDIWVRQSPEPRPPWQESSGVRCDRIEPAARRHAGYVRRMGAGYYPFHSAHKVGTGDGWSADIYNGWRLPAEPGDFDAELRDSWRFAPVLLMRELAGRKESLHGPNAVGDDELELRFRPGDGEPMELRFDARTRLLRSLEVGDITVGYDEYEMVQGRAVSRRMTMSWRGETVWRVRLSGARFDAPFPDSLEPPAGLEDVDGSNASGARDFQVRELADGVYLAGGGVTYQVYVEFRDFLVALGGVEGVARRLEAVRERTGDKPLRYAMITHHHDDHLAGVAELVDAGAVIVSSPAHESVIRDAAGAGRQPRFAFVEDRSEVTDGDRSVVFRALGPMRHSSRMLAALVPEEKLLFSADLFVQPPGRPVRASNPPIRDLAHAIRRLEIDATRLVDTHSPVVSNLAELRLAAGKDGDFAIKSGLERAICPSGTVPGGH